MTRKEGIIKRANDPENAKMLLAAGSLQKLIRVEYDNYKELCHYCYEKPLSFDEWTTQTIKQAQK